jgi:dTDP-4-dehydrorhamnose 3,5-epimerase
VSRFDIHSTPLKGLKVIERKPLREKRGSFTRLFCADDLKDAGWVEPIAQINQSTTENAGTVRGLHYQRPPHAEMKLVTCINGAVRDVAVDLRNGSITFMRHHAETLSAENCRALLIPPGFAHGFQSLTENATLIYLHSTAYMQSAEDGLNPFDSRLAIEWPQPVLQLSERDQGFNFVSDDFKGLIL